MEIRNTCVIFAGISRAKKEGYREVMTGDGSDELFAGYNYLRRYFSHLSDLDAEVQTPLEYYGLFIKTDWQST